MKHLIKLNSETNRNEGFIWIVQSYKESFDEEPTYTNAKEVIIKTESTTYSNGKQHFIKTEGRLINKEGNCLII